MATSTALRKLYIEERLDEQLIAAGIPEKGRDFVLIFLENKGIGSLDDVTQEDLVDFRNYANIAATGSQKAKSWYGSLLEQGLFAYLIEKARTEAENASASGVLALSEECISDIALRNKTAGYLLLSGIRDAKDIGYEVRAQYEAYLEATIAPRKVREYVKALDWLKLEDIKKTGKAPFAEKGLHYEHKKIFLLYYPDYEIANSVYYARDKEELVYDFSLSGAEKMKNQVFQMLVHVLATVSNVKDRRDRFLLPLKALYGFCLDARVDDIEQMTQAQVNAFRESIEGRVGTKTDDYMSIVWNVRKFLFLSADKTNWGARVWFLERLNFADGRMNPAREISTLDFTDINNVDNLKLFQLYMKYLLGISTKKSIQTIRGAFYHIKEFVCYMDNREISIADVTEETMKEYILFLNSKKILPETYNKALADIMDFYEYLFSKKKTTEMPLRFECFFKRTFEKHHDRSVSEEEFKRNLQVINGLPLQLRIMCLIIFTTGLRVSEVCAIRGDALTHDGKDAWIKVYQPKMKSDKRIPIPDIVYEIAAKYIMDNHIGAGEYLFQNKRGGAYNADTFSKQVNDCFEKAGIKEYRFKPHDYRHTLASKFYAKGIAIPVIRDYLGHRDSRMTRQYIDEMQLTVDALNMAFFQGKGKQKGQEA